MDGSVRLGNRGLGGDSTSSTLFADQKTHWDVDSTALPGFIEREGLQTAELAIKIDIEGGEYDLLPALSFTLRNCNAHIFLSLHPEFLNQSIQKGGGSNLWQRLVFAYKHLQVLRALPFRYLYSFDGRRISRLVEIVKALLLGRF